MSVYQCLSICSYVCMVISQVYMYVCSEVMYNLKYTCMHAHKLRMYDYNLCMNVFMVISLCMYASKRVSICTYVRTYSYKYRNYVMTTNL